MIHKKAIAHISALWMITMFIGCTDSVSSPADKEANQYGKEVCVTTNVAQPLSRAANLTSDNIDHFGLIVNRTAGNNNWTAESHASRTKSGDVWQAWNILPQLSWANLTNNVEVLAYAPFQSTSPITANAANRILTFNATTQPDTEPIDWVYYYSGRKSLSNLLDSEGMVPVNFSHIMSRLRIEITTREELDGIEATTVEVLGSKPTVEWISSAPTKINVKGNATTVYATSTGEAKGIWSTFIVPQTIASAELGIRVTINGKLYTYMHPNSLTFTTAKAYKLTLLLGRDRLELAPSGITVTDWETGDEIPGGDAAEKS